MTTAAGGPWQSAPSRGSCATTEDAPTEASTKTGNGSPPAPQQSTSNDSPTSDSHTTAATGPSTDPHHKTPPTTHRDTQTQPEPHTHDPEQPPPHRQPPLGPSQHARHKHFQTGPHPPRPDLLSRLLAGVCVAAAGCSRRRQQRTCCPLRLEVRTGSSKASWLSRLSKGDIAARRPRRNPKRYETEG